MLNKFLGIIDFIVPTTNTRTTVNLSATSANQPNNSTLALSPLKQVESALTKYTEGSHEFSALSNLKNLQAQVEETIANGQRSFGRGVFSLFDFV